MSTLVRTNSLANATKPGRPKIRNQENINRVHDSIKQQPKLSQRKRSQVLQIKKTSLNRIKNDLGFKPYKIQRTQKLEEDDPLRRLNFADWVLQKYEEDSSFIKSLITSSESNFHLNGHVNSHNAIYYSDSQPYQTHQQPLHNPKLNV